MELEIPQNQLQSLLKLLSSVNERLPTGDLCALYISYTDSVLEFSVSDSVQSYICHPKNFKCNQFQEIAIPAKRFFDVVKLFSSDDLIKIKKIQDQNKVLVTSSNKRYTLVLINSDSIKKKSELSFDFKMEIGREGLNDSVSAVSFAMASQDVRSYFNGVLLKVIAQQLEVVSSDGHRLCFYGFELDHKVSEPINVIMPSRLVNDLQKLLAISQESKVLLELNPTHLCVQVGFVKIISVQIAGKYPNYKNVLPKKNLYNWQLEREQLVSVIHSASVLLSDKNPKLTMSVQDEQLYIIANSLEGDHFKDLVCQISQPNYSISFNYRYLLDVFSKVNGDSLTIELQGPEQSCLIVGDYLGRTLSYILMPLQN